MFELIEVNLTNILNYFKNSIFIPNRSDESGKSLLKINNF